MDFSILCEVDGFVLGDGLLDGEGHAETLEAGGDVDDGFLAGLHAVEKVASLVEEEVVAVEVFDAEDLGFRLAEFVEADSEAGKVHGSAALVTDDLALARGGRLQEVLVELD